MNVPHAFRTVDAILFVMATSSSPFSAAAIYFAAEVAQRMTKELRTMKPILLHVAVAFAVSLGAATANAQMSQGGGEWGHGQGQPMSADQRLQMMTQQLNLTSDQQQQIKPILESEQQQMQALRQDSSLSQPDRMSKIRQIRESTVSQVKPILNADQQSKYQQMMSHQGHRGAMGQGQNPPQDQPHPQ